MFPVQFDMLWQQFLAHGIVSEEIILEEIMLLLREKSQRESLIREQRILAHIRDLLEELFPANATSLYHAKVFDLLLTYAERRRTYLAAKAGAFYTPRHLAYLLANFLQPQQGEVIADFACGGGRLLWSVYLFLQAASRTGPLTFDPDGLPNEYSWWKSESTNVTLLGCDIQSTATLQTQALLHLAGGGQHARIWHTDALSHTFFQQWEKGGLPQLDGVIANPPYGSIVDQESLAEPLKQMKANNAELLFIELMLQLLKPGGRAAIIIPDGVLFRREKAVCALRKRWIEEHEIRAIISLPAGAFAPTTNVKTSIVLFRKGGTTQRIWCYDLAYDGYTLDRHRSPCFERSDLPDVLTKYAIRFARIPPHEHHETPWLRETQILNRLPALSHWHTDLQLQWENVPPDRLSYWYAQPYVRGDTTSSRVTPLHEPKDWEIIPTNLPETMTLLPAYYRPSLE